MESDVFLSLAANEQQREGGSHDFSIVSSSNLEIFGALGAPSAGESNYEVILLILVTDFGSFEGQRYAQHCSFAILIL
ncbi:unnamed protein product [Cuscuta campestris]|uniref:Uncharacterized protein n=1 Tax=Cuscuta campestris TaxID=132261 RepID=A0A484LC16_9ASTE|nr:unnamed protein product [Cuscuta campestris]